MRAGWSTRTGSGRTCGFVTCAVPRRRRLAQPPASDRDAAPLKTHLSPRDLLLTLAIVALWGFSFVPIKYGLREIPPFALAALRFFFAAFPLVFFIPRPRIPWRHVAGYGFAIGVCQFGLLFLGMRLGMPAGLSSLVIQVQVFFTIGLAIAFLGDRLHAANLAGAVIAALGVVLLAAYKLAGGATATLIGFALVLVAAFAWGVGNVIAKRAAGAHAADMFALVVWSSLVPPLPLAALSWLFEGGAAAHAAVAHAGALAWGSVLFLAWGATLFGFASWAGLMHRYPTGLISPFALLIPVSGLASGALFLGESLAPLQTAGALLIFAGLAVNVYGVRARAWLRRVLD
jgi:O-acetylserine/cysteine efflux transporter